MQEDNMKSEIYKHHFRFMKRQNKSKQWQGVTPHFLCS